MKCDNTVEVDSSPAAVACNVRLPMGILGFEQMKDYLLIARTGEEPFRWLQVKGEMSLAFVVVEPFLVVPEYRPDIPEADVDFLGLSSPEEAVLYNMVSVHGNGRATVNLKGPIVINRANGVGKQVVITNAADYSVQHALPLS